MITKKRNPFVAFLLAAIFSSFGQIYNGQIKKAIIFFIISGILYSLFYFTSFPFDPFRVLILLIIAFIWGIYIIFDAVYNSIKIKEITLKFYNKWYFYTFVLLFLVCLSLGTNQFKRIKTYKIPSGSMLPKIHIGDHLFCDIKIYENEKPKRNDIIIFKFPKDRSKDFLKRVIGIEGDTIEIKNKQVFINNIPVKESFIIKIDSYAGPVPDRDNMKSVTIPPDSVFVLGDNRDNSHDSRFFGFVSTKDIIGKPLFIYWAKDFYRIGEIIK